MTHIQGHVAITAQEGDRSARGRRVTDQRGAGG